MTWTYVIRLQGPDLTLQGTSNLNIADAPADQPPPPMRMSWLNNARNALAKEWGVHPSRVQVTFFGAVVGDTKPT
jgi:hypothetical protein